VKLAGSHSRVEGEGGVVWVRVGGVKCMGSYACAS
jgi:hypothetical protein